MALEPERLAPPVRLCAGQPNEGAGVRDFRRRVNVRLFVPRRDGHGQEPNWFKLLKARAAPRREDWIAGPLVQFLDGPTLAHVASKSWDACS